MTELWQAFNNVAYSIMPTNSDNFDASLNIVGCLKASTTLNDAMILMLLPISMCTNKFTYVFKFPLNRRAVDDAK